MIRYVSIMANSPLRHSVIFYRVNGGYSKRYATSNTSLKRLKRLINCTFKEMSMYNDYSDFVFELNIPDQPTQDSEKIPAPQILITPNSGYCEKCYTVGYWSHRPGYCWKCHGKLTR